MRLDDVVPFAGILIVIVANWRTFANSVLSIECPDKDVSSIREQTFQMEFALILYYVSWCRESRTAKDVYSEVARHYKNEFHFAAVDCWHLECNCSRTIPSAFGSKKGYPQKWPTLIVHYGQQLTLQYRDEWSISALTRFVGNILRPVFRLNTRDDLKRLHMRSNCILLGLFQNASVAEYHQFTIAALKWLEKDPEKIVAFAVCFGAAANEVAKGIKANTPLIVLVTDKEIEIFNFVGKLRSDQLNTWLQTVIKRLSKHFMGYSTPALLLDHVRRGPVLTIFTSDLKHSNRSLYLQMSDLLPPNAYNFYSGESFNWNVQHFNEIQTELDQIHNNEKGYCKAKLKLNAGYAPFNKINEKYSKLYLMQFQPSIQFQTFDQYSAENLLKFYGHKERLMIQYEHNTPELQTVFAKLLMKIIEKVSLKSIPRHNRTMSVQIMDTGKYEDILQTLGAMHLNSVDISKTTVILIEPNQEGVYILQKPFSYENLLIFIKDYYNDNLYICRKTSSVPTYTSSTSSFPQSSSSLYVLKELNRRTFLNRVQHFWENTTTVLLLYTPRCAFSAMMSHTLLQISALLNDDTWQSHHINMVRLNTQTNDLPWEFITHRMPALIVLPKGRPYESRLFPPNLKIEVRNVFAFILAQLEPIDQVRVALSSCSPKKSIPPQKLIRCLHFARTLAMQHISDHLKLWQIFENERHVILERLKQFKDITLDIQKRFLL